MKLIFSIALLLWILIQPTSSRADFAYVGVGATSCGRIAQDYQREIEKVMMTWAQGFMSGANMVSKDGQYRDLAAMNIEAQEQSLKTYCDEHPMAQFIDAAMDLYFKLPFKKYPSPSQ
jgi:hypothetical protein